MLGIQLSFIPFWALADSGIVDGEAILLLSLKDLVFIVSLHSIIALSNDLFKLICEISVATSAIRIKWLRLLVDAVLHSMVLVNGASILLRASRLEQGLSSRGM